MRIPSPLPVLARLMALVLAFWTLAATAMSQPKLAAATLDLSGTWHFALGGTEPTFPQAAQAPAIAFADTIVLPGTTETRGKGPVNDWTDMSGLSHPRGYAGAAWYGREFMVPASWAGRRVVLEFERTRHTQVWLDGKAVGSGTLYCAPQTFDLTTLLSPGKHTLLVMVDNRMARLPVQANAHQYHDATGSNWNGLLGRLRLVSTPQAWIDTLEVHPDFANKRFRLKAALRNSSGGTLNAKVHVRVRPQHASYIGEPTQTLSVTLPAGAGTVPFETFVDAGKVGAWDEFTPGNLAAVTLTLLTDAGIHEVNTTAGLREFAARDAKFVVNGRTTFLRGKHDACVFPEEGHAPMDVEGWRAYMATMKAHGINHVRCHTWVPPEAAFTAADEAGIYLQPELPFWGTFTAAVRDALAPEAEAVLRAFGNHPSFVMLTLGNEIGGDRQIMNDLVVSLRARDPRRLYADGSNNVLWDPRFQPTNDFFVSAKTFPEGANGAKLVARGSFCVFDGDEGIIQWGEPGTTADLSRAIAGIPAPFLGHETAQWTSYPDYAQIADYRGVSRARNLEAFRASLERNGMAGMDKDFSRASAELAAELYREENELFLRTPGMDGFQILDLQDFPGQGTALVGLYDAHWKPKGSITPEKWRRSCDDLTILARHPKFTWTTAETFASDLQLAHYGAADITGAVTSWQLADERGSVIASGTLPARDLPQGGLRDLGRAETTLASVKAPARLTLSVTLNLHDSRHAGAVVAPADSVGATTPSEAPAKQGAGGPASPASDLAPLPHRTVTNTWPLWVYPASTPTATAQLATASKQDSSAVHVVRSYNADTRALLDAGARVVLIPSSRNWADTLPGGYATDYWSWPMFNGTPGTMGLLIDDRHPALAAFPTRFHSERQWASLAHASTPVVLTGISGIGRPLVQVIDNLERNQKLALVFEARVGRGSLLVCAVDLPSLDARPEARQLLASLLAYAASPAFAPTSTVPVAALSTALRPSLARGVPPKASSFFQPPWGAVPAPERAVDGDPSTRWVPAETDKAPSLAVDLGGIRNVDTLQLWWEHDLPGYAWHAEVSADGATWTPLCDQTAAGLTAQGSRHEVRRAPVPARFVRVTATAHPEGKRFCLRELRVLGE